MVADARLGRIKHIHFIGIGGVGMAGIAEVLLTQGYHVSGSDLSNNSLAQRLNDMGAVFHQGHDARYVDGANVVVVSSAVKDDNPEVVEAKKKRIPIVSRAAMLAELMRFRHGIAIAGTHGKTTTTSLTASLLTEAGLDPSFVIGGRLISAGSTARVGSSKYLVAEADESDASFLLLNPLMAVVTNIDNDHLENYQGDFEKIKNAFLSFIHRLPFYGLAVVCLDDPIVRQLLPKFSRPTLTYGLSEDVDFQLTAFDQKGTQTSFTVKRKEGEDISLLLNMPGLHNALNATAATIIALELGVDEATIQSALLHFQGVGRRFQRYGDFTLPNGKVTLVDDYAHHPKEVAGTLRAAKQSWPNRRIVAMFQPHRFTRTRDCFDHFCQVLSKSDALILLDVYSAGEDHIPNADSYSLARAIRERQQVEPVVISDDDDLVSVLQSYLQDGDVLVTMGAGSVGSIAQQLAQTRFTSESASHA
ncbi:MAG: UDP-N-acetylmuramate--L-alanine ligase [Gammaproteobacteria bacterium]